MNDLRTIGTDTVPYRVLVALRDEHNLCPLLRLACALARAHGGEVHLLTVTPSGTRPSWLKLTDDCHDVPVTIAVRSGKNVSEVILQEFRQLKPDTLILGWSGHPNQTNGPVTLMGQTWYRVFSAADHMEGWVVGDYLSGGE